MRSVKRILAVLLALCVLGAGTVFSSAATQAEFIAALAGYLSGSSTNVNITREFAEWLKETVNEQSMMDKIIENFRKGNGQPYTPAPPDPGIDLEEAAAVAELVNVSLMDIKRVNPGFKKTEYAALPVDTMKELGDMGGVLSAMIGAVTNNRSLVAAIINNSEGDEDGIASAVAETVFAPGSPAVDNMSVTGQYYVANISPDDISSYTVRISKTGAYTIRVDFKDRWPDETDGLKGVFDIPDTSANTIFRTMHSDIKYVDCALELSIDKYGKVRSYVTNFGCTICLEQSDGTYTTRIPVFNMDTQESGLIYTVNTTYDQFVWADRVMGDANYDGRVDASDARTVLRRSARLEGWADEDFKFSDVDGDGEITAYDARMLLRVSAQLQTFPAKTVSQTAAYERPAYQQDTINTLLVLMTSYAAANRARAEAEAQSAYLESLTAVDDPAVPGENPTTGMSTPASQAEDWIKLITGIAGTF